MGNKTRAERISKSFTNRTMQAIGFHMFNKCGNCVMRINCIVDGMLRSGGHTFPMQKIITDLENGCSKPKKEAKISILAKNAAKIGQSECNGCNKFTICVDNILNYMKIEDMEKRNKVHKQAKICANCPDLEKCCQKYCDEFRIRSYKLIIKFFLLRFRRCKKESMQMVSLDLEGKENMMKQQQVINITAVIPTLPEEACDTEQSAALQNK